MEKKKPTAKEVAQFLKDALQIFCDPEGGLRPELAKPFREGNCVFASDAHVLIRIKTKEAGCSISPFKTMDLYSAQSVVPETTFNDLLNAQTLRRADLKMTIEQMVQYEAENGKAACAILCGVTLSPEALSNIERAMAICGAELARLVWSANDKVVLELDNGRYLGAVTILQMGWLERPDDHIMALPVNNSSEDDNFNIDWQKGMEAWAAIKAEKERREEAERMARREVYMVRVMKVAFIPVYASNAAEARRLCKKHFIDPEDDGDDEWFIDDTVPEVVDLEDMDDCYRHVLTREGDVERDRIYELDQLSENCEKNQNKK